MLERESASLVTLEKGRVDRIERDSPQIERRQRKPPTVATENNSEPLEHKLVNLRKQSVERNGSLITYLYSNDLTSVGSISSMVSSSGSSKIARPIE